MGSPNADGNSMAPVMPVTERVENVENLGKKLLMPFVQGRRTWEELFRAVFAEEYPHQQQYLDQMVAVSLRQIDNGYVPVCVMDRYRGEIAYNKVAMWK